MTAKDGEITMFRMKSLKSSTIPSRWIVVHFDGTKCQYQSLEFRDGRWRTLRGQEGNATTIIDMSAEARNREVCWVVCEGIYEWLCHQGIYDQFVDGKVSLPMGNSSSNAGKLTGQFCLADPTIVDICVGEKRMHCIDFGNWGIHNVVSIDDAVQRLKDYVLMTVKLEMGSVKSTAAAQGLARYRTHDMGQHAIYCHQVPAVRKIERDAFYAGRAECLSLGHIVDPCYHYDAVSQHPTLCLTEKFPTKLIDTCPEGGLNRLLRHIKDGRHIFARVDLHTDDPDYPVRIRLPGGVDKLTTIYPTGCFATTLAHPEFMHSLEHGRIRKINYWSAYEADTIFRENSEWYLRAKDNMEELGLANMKGVLKLCQNSLYGNIGRRGRMWIDVAPWHDFQWGMWFGRHPTVGTVVSYRAVYGIHQYLDHGIEPEMSCPAISATVFSYCRLYLLKLILQAGRNNVHYYDTDGLIVNHQGHESFVSSTNGYVYSSKLLKLKENCSDVDIRGIKYYRFGERWNHAGVPEWAERNSDGSASFERHTPFTASMRKGDPFTAKIVIARTNPYPRYRHGVVGKGNRVYPFVLPMDV